MSILTPFEETGTLVDLATEADWYDDLVADSGRVTKVVLGTTTGGNPMHLLGIGGTAPPAWPPTAANGMVLVGAQHSYWEPAGREAVMAVARDCAYVTTPDRVAEWDARPLWVFPNWNPDNYETMTGGTNWAEGNPNRDSLTGAASATHGYYTAIRQIAPVTILDVHEHGSGGLSNPIEAGATRNLGVYGQGPMADEADAIRDFIISDMENEGYTVGIYPSTEVADPLVAFCQLAGYAGVLIETNGGSAAPLADRVARSTIAQHTVIEWHLANQERLAHIRATDLHNTAMKVRNGDRAWSVSNTVSALVAGYSLTAAQWSAASQILTTHGIEGVTDGDDGTLMYVPLDQPEARIAVRILDPSSPERKVDATRVATTPAWFTPAAAPAAPSGAAPERVTPSEEPASDSGLYFVGGDPAVLYNTSGEIVAING